MIEKGIANPKKQCKYPFGDMQVGDSLWAERSCQAILTAFKAWRKRTKGKGSWKAETWAETKKGVVGARIKRIK